MPSHFYPSLALPGAVTIKYSLRSFYLLLAPGCAENYLNIKRNTNSADNIYIVEEIRLNLRVARLRAT